MGGTAKFYAKNAAFAGGSVIGQGVNKSKNKKRKSRQSNNGNQHKPKGKFNSNKAVLKVTNKSHQFNRTFSGMENGLKVAGGESGGRNDITVKMRGGKQAYHVMSTTGAIGVSGFGKMPTKMKKNW